MANKKKSLMEKVSYKAQHWIGTPSSLVLHTILFSSSFISVLLGVELAKMLLVLTTIVSLEAIYLSIFIQMAVNRQSKRLKEVEADLDEVLEDTEELTEEDIAG
jgi:low affinity Fe/Cu permease